MTAVVKRMRRALWSEGVLGERFTGEALHSERPSGLRGVSLYSLRGRKLLSYFFLDAVAANQRKTEKQNITLGLSMKAPVPDQDIENTVKGHSVEQWCVEHYRLNLRFPCAADVMSM